MNHNLTSAKAQAEERWREFQEDHKNFDPRWVQSILDKVADPFDGVLPFIFSHKGLEAGFRAFYEGSDIELPPDFDLHSSVLPISSLEKLPLYRNYMAIRAYAYYGLRIDDADQDDQVDWEYFLEKVVNDDFPKEWIEKDEEVSRAIKAAWARTLLDDPNRTYGLAAEELAALAGVSRKSILNLLSLKSNGPFEINPDGSIEIGSARQWLSGRAGFKPSISVRRPNEEVIDGDPVFVPMDDGPWFSPEHALDGRFHVANGKQRKIFDDYWSALDFLSHARVPSWHYRDETGQLRQKVAHRWERKTRQEVERLIKSMRQQSKGK